MVSSVETVLALKAMAGDKHKRAVLVKDKSCIGGLALLLSNTDDHLVKLSLETLMLCAETPENREPLREFLGMTEQLEALMVRCDCSGVDALSRQLYETLHSEDKITPLKDTCNSSNTGSRRRSSIQKMLMGGHKSSKTIVLQLRGLLNKCDRDVCMRLLLQVKGVISITFDMHKKRCILRTKPDVRPESLVQAITRTQTIIAQQVVKNESGEELFLSFGSHQKDLDKENETELPDYLPDDEQPVVDDKAISRPGEEKKAGGWLSSAASFFTNSFYW